MTLPTEFLDWIDSMYKYLKNLRKTQEIPKDIHPPMPGTTITQAENQVASVSGQSGIDAQNSPPVEEPVSITITPDFTPAETPDGLPSKLEGSVLTIHVTEPVDFITSEIFTVDSEGKENLVLVGDSPKGAENLLVKLQRSTFSIKGKAFLRVKTSPPGGEGFGLETYFQIN